MQPEDAVRLQHMLEAAEVAASFMRGRTREDLGSDRMLLFAVVRALEVVGEAASKVSPAARGLLPGVPWRAMVAMRNRLIHGYFDIDAEVVWTTTQVELPPLIDQLFRTLAGRESD